ncbi:MAG TPA: ATP-binding protein [Bacteroidales bacterium]|nr:ATP-binding protein [Bacteroidales bacterium]
MIPDYIPRTIYLNRVLPFIGKPLIKVFTGQRRSGKSYIMLQTIDHIRLKQPEARILYINKEHPDYEEISDDKSLWNYVNERKLPDRQCFVFIDEIQEIMHFEKAIRGMLSKGGFDIYCTGSNATLLSGELATLLSGRYVEIQVHCLSYGEYLHFHKLENTPAAMWKFIQQGGMPFLIHLEDNDQVRQEYLRNVLNTILFKDIVQRFNVRNFSFLNNLMAFIADNAGSLVSANRISEFLKSQHLAISTKTIIDYLHFLESSYLIHRVKRYDIAGKRLFELNDKFYFEDLGLCHVIKPYDPKNIHKYLEGLVFRHLLQHSYKVYIGKLADKEIDFIAAKDDQTMYVQVCLSVADEKTFEREFGNLLLIRDNFKKYVITLDEFARGNHEGIEFMNLRDFLLEIH